MHLLVDGDILVYRAAFAAQQKDKETGEVKVLSEQLAIHNLRKMIINIVLSLTASLDSLVIGLTATNDETNFRKILEPTYKANRKDMQKPVHYELLRDVLQHEFNATVVAGYEADDLLCMLQYEHHNKEFNKRKRSSVIVSIDKDLDQVPGWHYNFVKRKLYYQSELDGLKCFYRQILIGDPADNIPRIKPRWRSKESMWILDTCHDEQELKQSAYYLVDHLFEYSLTKKEINDLIEKRGRLLWLLRSKDDMWRFA